LKEAGVTLRLPRGRLVPAKPANEVPPDPEAAKPASCADQVTPDSESESAAKPVAELESPPNRKPSASVCEPYREAIELGLSRGRNAKAIWQDLVDGSSFAGGYQSVI